MWVVDVVIIDTPVQYAFHDEEKMKAYVEEMDRVSKFKEIYVQYNIRGEKSSYWNNYIGSE